MPRQLVVTGSDQPPVAAVLGVQPSDLGLQEVGPVAAQTPGALERGATGLDLGAVPQCAILLGEQHELAVAQSRIAARVVQEHQRQQAEHLGLVRHQLAERDAQPDRLRRELAATVVARVEDQVHDRQHRCEAVGQQVGRRHPEGDARIADLALRAHQALCHRRLGYEEGARDLGSGEAGERAQRERDLRVHRERRVAAREDQLEAFVSERGVLRVGVLRLAVHSLLRLEQL